MRGISPKALQNQTKKSTETVREKHKNSFELMVFKTGAYIRTFYTMFFASVFDLLNDKDHGLRFATALSKAMQNMFNSLTKFCSDVESQSALDEGLEFTEKVIQRKIFGNNITEDQKTTGYKRTMAKNSVLRIQNDLLDSVKPEFNHGRTINEYMRDRLFDIVDKFSEASEGIDLYFQMVLDSLNRSEMTEYHIMLAKMTHSKLVYVFGDKLYSNEFPITNKVGESVMFVSGITGKEKTWFGSDCKKDQTDKCNEFNDKVIERLKDRDVADKFYKVLNISVTYHVSRLGTTESIKNDNEGFKTIIEKSIQRYEDKDKKDIQELYTGTVRWTYDITKIPHIFGHAVKKTVNAKTDFVQALSYGGVCSVSTDYKYPRYKKSYIRNDSIGVYPCSILDRLSSMKSYKNDLTTASAAIFDVVNEDRDMKNRTMKSIYMARLSRYLDTGRLPPDPKMKELITPLLKKIGVELPEEFPEELKIPDNKITDSNFVRAFYVIWKNYLVIKKGEGKVDYSKRETFDVKGFEITKKTLDIADFERIPVPITPASMCPYFSIPFTEVIKDSESSVKAGSDIIWLSELSKRHLKLKLNRDQSELVNNSIDVKEGVDIQPEVIAALPEKISDLDSVEGDTLPNE